MKYCSEGHKQFQKDHADMVDKVTSFDKANN